jgi:hypothetical protein
MKIEDILKQITPEARKREIEKINKVKLPSESEKWVSKYSKIGEREKYLWLWAYESIQIVTLSSVDSRFYNSLWKLKLLIVMFITLIDDVADEMQNEILLDEMQKVCFRNKEIRYNHLTSKEREYLEFTILIWKNINISIKKYPRFNEFKDIWEFDICQTLNTMKYACLINKNTYLINEIEYWAYFPNNIQFVLSGTIDLMCSSKFKVNQDAWKIREISWRAQKIAQAMNWITTWEREIKKRDFSSGVFAHAIKEGVLEIVDLDKKNIFPIIKKIKDANIENIIIKRCNQDYSEIKKLENDVESVDIKEYLIGLRKYIKCQLISRGNY